MRLLFGVPNIHFSTLSADVCRSVDDVYQHFKSDITFDYLQKDPQFQQDALNGSGDKNWFMHIEKNLNEARSHNDYLKYKRLLHISWPSDVSVIDYMRAQRRALLTGYKLSLLLQQLYLHEIQIEIIGHSLGCAVVLSALQALAIKNLHGVIDKVWLWQAAVPSDIFSELDGNDKLYKSAIEKIQKDSPLTLSKIWPLHNAWRAAKSMNVLYTQHDNILGPRLESPYQQKEIDQLKDMSELYTSKLLNHYHLQCVYSLANEVGVPPTALLNRDFRGRFYSDWISQHPKGRSNNHFKPTLESQSYFYVERDGHSWMIASAKVFLKNFLPAIDYTLEMVDVISDGVELIALLQVMHDSSYEVGAALGYAGIDKSDKQTFSLLESGRLQEFDQGENLPSHSAMKIPTPAIMQHVYKEILSR